MLKIGLTGGIGSGKSTIAAIFEVLGIPVYYADVKARQLMNEDTNLITEIKAAFGEESYSNGLLNKPYISSLIFSDNTKRDVLNSIVHPSTIADATAWMNRQTTPYCIKEAALIFESHAEKKLDFIIGVAAPEEIRINRIINRDAITREQVEARIKSQMNEADKIKRCDYVIVNDDKELLIPQVLALHHLLIEKVAHKKKN